jgi:hypothetical protein
MARCECRALLSLKVRLAEHARPEHPHIRLTQSLVRRRRQPPFRQVHCEDIADSTLERVEDCRVRALGTLHHQVLSDRPGGSRAPGHRVPEQLHLLLQKKIGDEGTDPDGRAAADDARFLASATATALDSGGAVLTAAATPLLSTSATSTQALVSGSVVTNGRLSYCFPSARTAYWTFGSLLLLLCYNR